MREAVVVSAVRTAVGRAPNGALRSSWPVYLAAEVVKEVIKRAPGLKPEEIEDLVMGCAFPEAEMGFNIGRLIVLKAGLPVTISGQVVNRWCASGLESIATAAYKIMSGAIDIAVAGGVESMSMVPLGGNKPIPDPDLVRALPQAYILMGLTAENVAEKYGISRKEQDEFSLISQQKAAKSIKDGKFKKQILPVKVTDTRFAEGKVTRKEVIFDTDECPRPDTTMEGLAKLKPLFRANGSVTAGNACPTSDGAAAVVIMTREKAKELGLKPMAVFRSYATGGVEPELMGIGPVVAIPKALKLAGIQVSQVDLFELNEAFASQAFYVVKTLGIDANKLNVNGGAIAMGHPLGCTGANLTTKLLYEMEARGSRYGVVSMCIGGGMGAAGVFERE
jgi:acetyl-CoA acyltransferase